MQGLSIMIAVQSSDVIIVDPNRYAVAIRYDENTDKAPMIVARGNDSDATHIQQIARNTGVHSMESPLLAQALCGTCLPLFFMPPPSKQIPAEFHLQVAEILAYVYKLANEQTP